MLVTSVLSYYLGFLVRPTRTIKKFISGELP